MNGILIMNKPAGKSSHGVVYAVRRITGERKVGHAGTLDPMATGVLVICLGQAVRVSEFLVDHDKKYRARVRLGVETDTFDATGRVVETHPVNVDPARATAALQSFLGKISQVPPAHSAIQRDGVRAYKLARQGLTLEMEPRGVEIYGFDSIRLEEEEVEFVVACSKGTYIRSLAHDLGARLGTGAHLSALTRLASGPFTIEASLTLEELERVVAEGHLAEWLLPLDRALTQFDELHLEAGAARAVRQGRFLAAPPGLTTPLVRAYDEQGRLVALLERSDSILKPKKVFER
jgi:tRNA pseudouridine55 synthase